MKKTFQHNGITFVMHVTLNAFVERRPGGKVQHSLSVTAEGTNWVQSFDVDNDNLTEKVKEIEQICKDYADGTGKPDKAAEAFAALGFVAV